MLGFIAKNRCFNYEFLATRQEFKNAWEPAFLATFVMSRVGPT